MCFASMKSTCASTASLTSAASSSRPTTKPTASICRPTIAGISWRGRTFGKEDFTEGYWNDLWAWYGGGGDCHVAAVPRRTRPHIIQPEGPSTEDTGILGHRRCQPCAGRCRTRRRARSYRQSERLNAGHDQRPRDRQLPGLDPRPQRTAAPSPTGLNNVATCQSETTPQRTACGKSTAPDRLCMRRTPSPSGIALPPHPLSLVGEISEVSENLLCS